MHLAINTVHQKYNVTPIKPITNNLCEQCLQNKTCLSHGLNRREIMAYNTIVKHPRKLSRGDYLYRSGDYFDTIYMIRSGSLKTTMIDEEGREQVLSFSVQGDFTGLDGLFLNSHPTEAQALETTFVCGIPISQYINLATETPILYQKLLDQMGSRIIEEEEHSLMLGTKNSNQRLASFLLNMSQRNQKKGLDNKEITLNMSRRDIGNYLSAAVETVSRIFTRLQEQGLIDVHGKKVQILDIRGLENIASKQ